jgi:hypothetical protein
VIRQRDAADVDRHAVRALLLVDCAFGERDLLRAGLDRHGRLRLRPARPGVAYWTQR